MQAFIISSLFIVFCITVPVTVAMLTTYQQRLVRRILSNPETPYDIRVQTQHVVFQKYHIWSHNVCAHIFKRYRCRQMRFDFQQSASAGLLLAIQKYDWSRPTSFPKYAQKYVLGSVYDAMDQAYQTQNHISFIEADYPWIFHKQTPESEQIETVEKEDILEGLNPEEKRLFEYVYGHLFDQNKKKSVAEVCELMAFGGRETLRLKKNTMLKKIKNHNL
jgi:DNA-directed RNA polymerase sigma subunit (sigma70/sigma32)